ncbi:MAG: hypothetical protein NTV30_08915 [Chloroflexi bacterium]|nr:hypothetical protein [Chloroflexota bacterium]
MATHSFRQINRRVYDDTRSALQVVHGLTTIGCGRKVVSGSGTPVTLVAVSTAFKVIDIQALETNSGFIVVGDSHVVASPSTARKGISLMPTGNIRLEGSDLLNIYLDAEISGEGVVFTYYN